MAPFAFLNHHSFRRSASSQSHQHLTTVPESGLARPTADMGAIPSKVGTTETPHKKLLRPRSSSLHLLKRSRTPSANATVRASCVSQPTPIVDTTVIETGSLEAEPTVISLEHRSDSEITVKTLADSVRSLNHLKKSQYDDSASDASSTVTATRVTPPSNDQEELPPEDTVAEPSGMITPVPHSSTTPKIMLPTPPFLPEDSPTKYGLRATQSPSPDRSLTAAQRKKMSGAGLFAHAATQQRSASSTSPVDQAKSGAVDPHHPSARSSSALPLSDKANTPKGHYNSLPNRRARPRYDNPFKDPPHEHVAHALPVRNCQRACFREHDLWQRMGMNHHHPVSCAVCDGYDPPGDDFMACLWCEMHVCGRCYSAFVRHGVTALTERQHKR